MRSVRAKLLSSFAIVLAFVFALGLTGLSQIKKVSDVTSDVTGVWLFGIDKIMQIDGDIERFLGSYYQTQLTQDKQQQAQLSETSDRLVAAIDEGIRSYGTRLVGEEDEAQYGQLVEAWTKFQNGVAKTAAPGATKDELAAASIEVSEAFVQLRAAVDGLIDYNHAGAETSKEEVNAVYSDTSSVLFFLGIGILIVVVALAWGLIVNLTRPLRATTAVMDRMSAGDLRVDLLRIDRKDEFGVMMESVNKTLLALRQSVQQMQEASTSVAAASSQQYAS